MERQKIYNAFDSIKPTEASKTRMLDNILMNTSEISPTGKDGLMKHRRLKPVLIAAVVVVMLLTMGAAIVRLTLPDLVFGEYVVPEQIYTDDDGNIRTAPEVRMDSISIQGVKDSPNQKALQEWEEFKAGYDPDNTLMYEADANNYMAPEEYQAYGVYTQEMIDKLDEITQKYGLKLLGPIHIVQKEEKQIFWDTLGLTQLHREDADVDVSYFSGYFYDCGTFTFNFNITLPENDSAVSCTIRYSVKDYFDPAYFNVNDLENIEQWNYTTADGTEILIILDNHFGTARLMCDREDAFISVRLQRFSTRPENSAPDEIRETITKADAEFIADAIDFTVKPQV